MRAAARRTAEPAVRGPACRSAALAASPAAAPPVVYSQCALW